MFQTSLAEDVVDRFISTWVVLLLLILAFTSFLLPLSPFIAPSLRDEDNQKLAYAKHFPKAVAHCFCPADFKPFMVTYANMYCAMEADKILRYPSSNVSLSLYEDLRENPRDNRTIRESRQEQLEALARERELETGENNITSRRQELVTFRAPLVLFLLALVLTFPQLIWYLFTHSVFHCVNLHETLQSCVASQSLDVSSRKRWIEETVMAVNKNVRSYGNTASSLYIFLKVLTVLVIIGETLFVCLYVMVDIHKLKEDTNGVHCQAMALLGSPQSTMQCHVKIRYLDSVQTYPMQCLFHLEAQDDIKATQRPCLTGNPSSNVWSVFLLYQCLFTIVLALLLTILIASIINLVSWCVRLCCSSRVTALGLTEGSSRDVALLVHMARVNAGPVVAHSLSSQLAVRVAVAHTHEAHAKSVTRPPIENKI